MRAAILDVRYELTFLQMPSARALQERWGWKLKKAEQLLREVVPTELLNRRVDDETAEATIAWLEAGVDLGLLSAMPGVGHVGKLLRWPRADAASLLLDYENGREMHGRST